MSTKVGNAIQVVRTHHGRDAGRAGRVCAVVPTAEGFNLLIIKWDSGRFGLLEPGYDQWINLGNPPTKDMSTDIDATYIQEAVLGQRRRR